MILAHNIGVLQHSNYNTREQILACNEPIGFDGVYLSVWENRDILAGKDFYLFVMGDYIGKNNYFDMGAPKLEEYCNQEHLSDLIKMGGKLGWHTWTHRDLTKLSLNDIIKEVTPPQSMKYFAYPYGKFDDIVEREVRVAGYEYAWSVTEGNGSRFQKLRHYL